MTDAEELRTFTAEILREAGAEVRDDGTFLWASLPDAAQAALDLPSQACVTLDPDRTGEFDAELAAPGSYLLEKLLAFATRRGRWDVARLASPPDGWEAEVVRSAAAGRGVELLGVTQRTERPLALFAFRTAFVSDEKREGFHLIAATLDGAEAWPVAWPLPEDGLASAAFPGIAPDLGAAYRRAKEHLSERMRHEADAFQKASLAALEEEVRRVFRYFDGTVAEVKDAAPSGAEDVVRAIEAERDRRLAEAVERFEPHAAASLCSVRVLFVPEARVAVRTGDGSRGEACIDALTRHVRGLPEAVTGDGPAPPQGRRPSDTPRPRTRGGPRTARSPRGPRARSRSAASRRRGP